jgi:predicted nucleic acid-binding protein
VELADSSVWARKRHPAVREWFEAAVIAGDIAVCDMVALELLHSASRPDVFARTEEALKAMPWLRMGGAEWARAREVYRLLSDRGQAAHRAVKHADLLIAAAAEVAGIGLVHYDNDYDLIAEVTGQTARWVRPRGTI